MKFIFFTSLLLAVPAAFSDTLIDSQTGDNQVLDVDQVENQADSCMDPTKYHPPGSGLGCVPCNPIENQADTAKVHCSVGDSDRTFDPNQDVHCKQGYYADLSVTPNKCEELTICGAADVSTATVANYEKEAPKKDADRVCSDGLTVCNDEQFQFDPPNATHDRVCRLLDKCDEPGVDGEEDRYMFAEAPVDADSKFLDDRDCRPRRTCGQGSNHYIPILGEVYGQYQTNAPADGSPLPISVNRICAAVTQKCSEYSPSKWQRKAATNTSDIDCQEYQECVLGETYETRAKSWNANRLCDGIVSPPCTNTTDNNGYITGDYELLGFNKERDRVCRPITECQDGYFQISPPTYTEDRVCSTTKWQRCPYSVDSDGWVTGHYEITEPSVLNERGCAPIKTCDGEYKHESVEPEFDVDLDMYTKDRECADIIGMCDGVEKYQSRAPTRKYQRICSLFDTCTSDEWQSNTESSTVNRECRQRTTCENGEYESNSDTDYVEGALGDKKNRQCSARRTCLAGQYESNPDTDYDSTTGAFNARVNRICFPWDVCGSADVATTWDPTSETSVLTGTDSYETTGPSGLNNRICTAQPAACTADEYESVIGDQYTKRVCSVKTSSCAPGQFLLKSVDSAQAHHIDNQCAACPEELIPHVKSTVMECDDICTMLDDTDPLHVSRFQTVATQCSSTLTLVDVANTEYAADNFDFSGFSCQMQYYKDGQTCKPCLDPLAGFKPGTNVICTGPHDVVSFICDSGYYIARDDGGVASCVEDNTPCPTDGLHWTDYPVTCTTFNGNEICDGVDEKRCPLLTACSADEVEDAAPDNSTGIFTSDRVCVTDGVGGCPAGQYAINGECRQCIDDITNVADRTIATTCTMTDGVVHATACVSGFTIHNNKCVFDTTVTEHNIGPSSNCKFKKLSDVFDFEWTFIHEKATNSDFTTNGIKFREFRQTQYYLGKTTATFQLKQYDETSHSYNYFSLASTSPSADYKSFAKTQINDKDEVFQVVCFAKPAYPDLLTNNYQQIDHNDPKNTEFVQNGCTEIKYITPFSYDPEDQEWTHLLSTPVVSATVPTSSHYTKSVGVSSRCGTPDATTIHDVFAWSTLKTNYNEVANFKLRIDLSGLQSGQNPGDGNVIDSSYLVEGIEFEGNVEVFDLLYISGDYTSETKTGTSAIDTVTFTDVIAPNGPHNTGNIKIAGGVSHKCSVDLAVTSPNSDFHCFDTTGIMSRESNSYTSTHLNQGTSLSSCTATLSSNCVATVDTQPSIEDSRECNDDETYIATCSITVEALKTEIGVKSVIIDAIRLRDTHQFPKGHVTGTFDATAFGATTDAFSCDDATCTSDPYMVLGESSGTYAHTCKWFSSNSAQSESGSITTPGRNTGGSPRVFQSTCAPEGTTSGSIASTDIRLPGKIFPQFYVYGITTFSKSPTIGGLPNTIAGARRLGGRTEPKSETKSVFVVSPQTVVAK